MKANIDNFCCRSGQPVCMYTFEIEQVSQNEKATPQELYTSEISLPSTRSHVHCNFSLFCGGLINPRCACAARVTVVVFILYNYNYIVNKNLWK